METYCVPMKSDTQPAKKHDKPIAMVLVGELIDAAYQGLKKGDFTAFSMIREMLKEGSLAAVGAQELVENADMPTDEDGKSGPKHLCSVQGGCVSAS